MKGKNFYEEYIEKSHGETVMAYISQFVDRGYPKIPTHDRLADNMEELIRENGWGDKDAFDIALFAGMDLGMKVPDEDIPEDDDDDDTDEDTEGAEHSSGR